VCNTTLALTKYLHQDIDVIPKKILLTGPLKTIGINKKRGNLRIKEIFSPSQNSKVVGISLPIEDSRVVIYLD